MMALADFDPHATGQDPAPGSGGRFARGTGAREAAPAAELPGLAPEPLDVPALPPSARDAEHRRAARARQAVVARWLRQLSR